MTFLPPSALVVILDGINWLLEVYLGFDCWLYKKVQTPLSLLMIEDMIQTFNDQGPNTLNHASTFCLHLKI